MNDNMGTPPTEAPANKNRTLIIVIVVLLVLCCCCVAGAAALYFGYDSLGDPLGIYGLLQSIV
jgi:hypothetical protein